MSDEPAKPIDWIRIFKWLGEKYHWASPEAIGALTMEQLRLYLAANKDSEELPEGTREINFWEVNKVVEEARKRKAAAQPAGGK